MYNGQNAIFYGQSSSQRSRQDPKALILELEAEVFADKEATPNQERITTIP